MSSQSTRSCDSRIADWATANRQVGSSSDFASRLDGAQVGAELLDIFRETPEFGRSLAIRIDPFLDESSVGQLSLLGGGGEAAVFYDEPRQIVIKLFAPPGKAGFGWVTDQNTKGRWTLRAGTITEALVRFFWFEQCFASGLEMDLIGAQGQFLALRQPFILGHHPDELALHAWMLSQGWTPWAAPSDLALFHDLTWRREDFLATDVRPENALIAEADGRIYPIDFIMGKVVDR